MKRHNVGSKHDIESALDFLDKQGPRLLRAPPITSSSCSNSTGCFSSRPLLVSLVRGAQARRMLQA